MHAKALPAAAIAAALLLSGCLVPAPAFVGTTEAEGEPAQRPSWSADDWWSYRLETADGGAASATYVVHEAGPEGYHLGSNRSDGFFGIPFHGELEPDLDPRVAGERWDMFRFPLQDGQAWTQRFLGHVLTTTVHGTTLEGPAGDPVDGYRLEAEAYGAKVATYTYAPDVGWMTGVTLWDPEAGEPLVWANLTDHGADYGGRYLVEEPVEEVERTYPHDLPGRASFAVDESGRELVATLTVRAEAGHAEAELQAPGGETVAAAAATGQDRDQAQGTWPVEDGEWTLEHAGSGAARVHLDLRVVHVVGSAPGQARPQDDPGTGSWGGPLTEALR